MRHRIVPLLQWPLTLSAALMVALSAETRASCNPDHDFLLPRDHGWMAAFRVVHAVCSPATVPGVCILQQSLKTTSWVNSLHGRR
jgi:hypothetical protein